MTDGPPYSADDSEHRCVVCGAGAHVVWLDMTLPMYRKDTWQVECEIGIRRSNHRFRSATVFGRLP